MRKIPEHLDNPYDNIMINLSENATNIFKKYNFSPNDITSLSIIFALLSTYCILSIDQNKILYKSLAAIFYGISYYFDCLDGHYARKFNMSTDFGDKYDHYGDIFKNILIIYALFLKLSKQKFIVFVILYIISMFFVCIHLGCQEKLYNKNNGHMLETFKFLCFSEPNFMMKYTRYCGCGTVVLLTIIFILLI